MVVWCVVYSTDEISLFIHPNFSIFFLILISKPVKSFSKKG